MSEGEKGRGRGRGGRKDGRQGDSHPSSPSSAASTPSSASSATGGKRKGKGRGRGNGGDQPQMAPGGIQEGAAASASVTAELEKLTVMEAGDVAASKEPSTKPKGRPQPEQKLAQAMKRPGFGTQGKVIPLYANHFPLKIPANMKVHHYDFAIARKFKRKKGSAPSTKPKLVTRRRDEEDDDDDAASVEEVIGQDGNFEIVLRRRRRWPKWLALAIYSKLVNDPAYGLVNFRHKMAFDGAKNVFAQCRLPVPTGDGYNLELQIPDEQRMDTFVVTVNHVAEVSVDLREVFNRSLIDRRSTSTLVLDVILRQSKMFSNVFISHGARAFYHPPNPVELGGGIWHYKGIWESVRPVSGWKSTINLDLANTAFVKAGRLLEFLHEIARNWQTRALDQRETKALEKLVKGVKVNLNHRPGKRTVRCIGVSYEPANKLTFSCPTADGKTAPILVTKYFQMMHQKGEFLTPVQFPHLPCLHVGSKDKKNYIPLEFCEIKGGQRYNHKLNDQQTSNMLKAASQPAPDRKRMIEEEAQHFGLNKDPYMQGFGLAVEMQMVKLNGRILAAPSVEYDKQVTIVPKDGGWNVRDVRVIRGATIRKWAVINTDPNITDPVVENFCRRLIAEAGRLGITFVDKNMLGIAHEGNAERIESILGNMKARTVDPQTKANILDLVFVILPGKNTVYYSSTKSAGDVVLGVNTQCVLGKNVFEAKPALLGNLLLKINAKMGGVNNNKIQQLREPVLIIGADVNHPAPTDGETAPSVAAVVANVDTLPAQYLAKIMVQLRRQEPIAELDTAVCEMINNFRKRNGCLPLRIIMYRDGVGESMFLKVLTDELHAIRRACEKMGNYFKVNDYQPPITFIVVQKRHHTRLFCADQRDEMGRGRNIPPGTTVDTTIVHPEEFDFYLCSHLGLQGTSRPTHYHVLWDDSNFSADELQMLTYYLCYTYARAFKSVSIPPPCYYADLCAYRARQYLSWSWQSASESGSTVSSASAVSVSELQKYVAVKENVAEKGMFFV